MKEPMNMLIHFLPNRLMLMLLKLLILYYGLVSFQQCRPRAKHCVRLVQDHRGKVKPLEYRAQILLSTVAIHRIHWSQPQLEQRQIILQKIKLIFCSHFKVLHCQVIIAIQYCCPLLSVTYSFHVQLIVKLQVQQHQYQQ